MSRRYSGRSWAFFISSCRLSSSTSRWSNSFSCSSSRMRMRGGGIAATWSGDNARTDCSFVTVCSSLVGYGSVSEHRNGRGGIIPARCTPSAWPGDAPGLVAGEDGRSGVRGGGGHTFGIARTFRTVSRLVAGGTVFRGAITL